MSYQVDGKKGLPSSFQALGIQIGDIRCALMVKNAKVYHREAFRKLERLYHGFLTKELTDITIELEGTDRFGPSDLDTVLSDTRYIHDENCFRTTSNLIDGQYDLTRHSIRITGEKSLADRNLEMNHLNKLLALAYYSACKVKYDGNPPAMLVHACGILRRGRVFIFAGPSEAGKTTIARLCGKRDGEVINDEMLLVSRPTTHDRGINVRSVPVLGRFLSRPHITAPLCCILLLKKSSQTQVHPIDKTEAYLRFMRQIITPAYIGQKDRRATGQALAR